ncbi:uncharacterized protein BDZ99DRAFT_400783 [Mytilinidion resinicola]|uniref:Uncharacterized protein n=1 Tax=Mytilinidion resinicola TaxID=574789 RepID=A0A6A6Y2W6_9PEZI|nr:uncharacterized protein BDZ99DRAFT_400783 [Mytilinidion resinicola]KAF2803010.1 hypothetical protein BDZ99DRAFT_400783 [Mytilinidion resinicola]
MLELQLSASGKRQRSERPQPNEISQPALKKRRVRYPSGSQPPPAFWNNLSKIWLTRQALRELDRRNPQVAPTPPCSLYQQVRRPVTRNFLAELKRNRQTESKRNRQTAKDTAHDLRSCNPRTLKDIKQFSRHGGPDLSNLRNYPEPLRSSNCTMTPSQSSPGSQQQGQQRGRQRGRQQGRQQGQQQGSENPLSTKPTPNAMKTKKTGPYDRNFLQHLTENGIYCDGYEYPDGSVPAKPNNWEDLKQVLAQRRPSLSPSRFSDGKFEGFRRANKRAHKEKQVAELVIPIIEGTIDDRCRVGGIPFNNLDHLTDGSLRPGNPDVYYGAPPEQLTRKVLNELGGHILPTKQEDLPIAPNFFLATKGPDGSLAVAGRQACYDGALGARGMHSLQSYGKDEPVFDNNAYTITSTYHGGTLGMYTSHPAQASKPGARQEYIMHQLKGWSMTGDPEAFRQGATAYRNARDWTKVQRDEAIRQANERANSVAAETPALAGDSAGDASGDPGGDASGSLNEEGIEESDSLTEELADYRPPAKRSRTRSEPSQTERPPAKRSSRRSKPSQTERKQRNAGESTDGSHSHGSAVIPVSQSSRAVATTQQREE